MGERDPAAVRGMFGRIAARYDLANTVLSLGADGRWRRLAAAATGARTGDAVLDVAAGTGKLTRELRRRVGPRGRVVGVDFSPAMLAVARRSDPTLELHVGDALRLPFPGATFDAATMAFGLRNVADGSAALREMARVVKPGGRLVVLEFVRPPRNLFGGVYRLYLRHGLPRLGALVAGDRRAYRYLSGTIDAYHRPPELLELAAAAGWRHVRLRLLALGTVAVLQGRPPAGSADAGVEN